jgi:hypothetical protein
MQELNNVLRYVEGSKEQGHAAVAVLHEWDLVVLPC